MEKQGNREVYAELRKTYPELVPKSTAAKILGVSHMQIYRLIQSKRLRDKGRSIALWEIARFLVS